MPREIKITLILLIATVMLGFIGTYLDMGFYSENGEYDPYIYSMDFIWSLIVVWIGWDVACKRKDLSVIFLLLPIIIVVMTVWNFIEYGFLNSAVTGIIEAILFILIYFLVKGDKVRSWQNATS